MKPSAITARDHIARDHHPLAVETVEQHAGDRTRRQHRHRARQKNARDDEPRVRVLHRETHHRDVVEVIANLAHHLARTT